MRLRPEIAPAMLDMAYPRPTLDNALRIAADGLRHVFRDPIEAEQKIGQLYGHVFKKKEAEYDARAREGRLTKG